MRRDPRQLLDLLEVRRALEVHIASLAAAQAGRAAVAAMELALAAMRGRPPTTRWPSTRPTSRFHASLAAGAGNQLLSFLIEAMEEPLRASRMRSMRGHLARGGTVEDVIEQHARILDRVRARDAKGAATAMLAHLEQTARDLRAAFTLTGLQLGPEPGRRDGGAMKVVGVETVVVGTPWRELTFVELVTDDGLRGVGEARMVNKTDTLLACIDELARRYVVGMDPFDLERLAWQFQWAEYGRAGEVTQTALAVFDVACYDLMGQATGEPVWRLLGGRFRDRVPAYANGWYQGDRDPEAVARLAGAVVARGYRGLKIDPFGAATAELGQAELGARGRHRGRRPRRRRARDRADGGDARPLHRRHRRPGGPRPRAVRPGLDRGAGAALQPGRAPPGPRRDLAAAGHRRARARAAGVPRAVRGRPGRRRPGRPDPLRRVHRAAASWPAGPSAYDLLLAPHNVCGPVGTAANLHFAVATGNYKVLEHFNDFADPWVAELVDGAPRVDPADGCFALPTGAGARRPARPRGGRPAPPHRRPFQPGQGGVGAT